MVQFKILYILGTGRSGSTLIDIILGNSEKIQSLGEIYHTLASWIKNKDCSCGKESNDCIFWSRVKIQFLKNYSEADLINLKAIQNKYERNVFAPFLLLLNSIFPSKNFSIYKKQLHTLYEAIAEVSTKPVFIDSSKNPFRAYALKKVFKDNFYCIHLVRDGRGALWSWIKSGTIPPFGIPIKKIDATALQSSKSYKWWTPWLYSVSWIIYNLFSSYITKSTGQKQAIRIKYEQILTHNTDSIIKIGKLIEEDLNDLNNKLLNKTPLKTGHLIAGNRLRLLKEIKLKEPDEEWRIKLFENYKKIFWMLAGWLSKRYGYEY